MMGAVRSLAKAKRFVFVNIKEHNVSLRGNEVLCLLLSNLCTRQEFILIITFLASFTSLLLMNIEHLTVNSDFQQQNKQKKQASYKHH